jgi:hypothetical protein
MMNFDPIAAAMQLSHQKSGAVQDSHFHITRMYDNWL